jgi:predicted secreted Zn-dependent protease
MSEKLKERDANDDKAKRFHDSFVSNALDLCGLLTHMNVTGDSKLEQARRQLEQAMTGVEVDGIKDCSATRANVKSKLDSILKQFEF